MAEFTHGFAMITDADGSIIVRSFADMHIAARVELDDDGEIVLSERDITEFTDECRKLLIRQRAEDERLEQIEHADND